MTAELQEALDALRYLKEQTTDMDIEYGIDLTEGEQDAHDQASAILNRYKASDH